MKEWSLKLNHHHKIEWRRNKVHELLVKGHSQYEIAETMHISQPTISRDIQYLRQQAKEELRFHIEEKLPDEYQRCLRGINEVLKIAWDIANSRTGNEDRNIDEKTRLQALSLVNECYKFRIDLLTNSSVLADAMNFVEKSRQKLNQSKPDSSINHCTCIKKTEGQNLQVNGEGQANDTEGSEESSNTKTRIRYNTINQTF
jgi:uncharacterized protein YerC